MKLRSVVNKLNINEFQELQVTLRNMGCYEEGMTIEEMREIMEAIENSVIQNDPDFERALRESELDFRNVPNESMHNSTMINALSMPNMENVVGSADFLEQAKMYHRSPSSSPDLGPKILTIHALVHHPLDWSPLGSNAVSERNEQRLLRKRILSSEYISSLNDDSQQTDSKRSYTNEFNTSSSSNSPPQSADSGFNWSESSSSANAPNVRAAVPPLPDEFDERIHASSSSVAVSDYRETTDEDGSAYRDLSNHSQTSL